MSYYGLVPFLPETSVGYLVRRIHQHQVAALEPVFATEGLTLTQWSAMVSIHLARATTCAELARDLAHDKGAMTRLLDQMEGKGWVTRERSGDDRRLVHLALTPAGEAVTLRCRAQVSACWDAWLDDWAHDDVDRLIASLGRLSRTLEAVPAFGMPA